MHPTVSLLARTGPFLIIGSLIASAFLFQLKPVVDAVAEPPLARSDLFWGMAQPDSNVIWMVGNNGKIVRSDDAGASWRAQQSGLHNGLQAIVAWSPLKAAAAGSGGRVVVTDDGGDNWTSAAAPVRADLQFLAAAIDPAGRLWLLGERGTALMSADSGASFHDHSDPRDLAWNGIAFTSAQTGWMVGEFGEIRRTIDGGASWQTAPALPRSLMATAACGDGRGVAVGLNGLLATTADDGANWNVHPQVTHEHLLAVTCDSGQWAAVGDRGIALTGPLEPSADNPPRSLDTSRNTAPTWHTAIVGAAGRRLIGGASSGILADGRFTPFSG